MVLGNPLSYSHLKVFGCLCFAHNLSPQRHKFNARSKPRIFIGYPFGQKGYKFYDLAVRTIYTCRDVLFYEHVFPFRGSFLNHLHIQLYHWQSLSFQMIRIPYLM